ncbi:MAG TPA: hypothetical protein VFA83_19095 [Acidimicrobiales bacterium]|nr:hypothetical protein [Acidimicrobiales bacterium]
MSELGDVLALLHRPEPRYRTLHAEGTEWRHSALLHEAFTRSIPPGAEVATVWRADGREEPETRLEQWRLWEEPPDRLRAEYAVGDDIATVIFQGPTWWSHSASMGALTNNGAANSSPGKGPGEVLFRPARLLPMLQLTVTGRSEQLGRPAYNVRGEPRPLDRHRDRELHSLGSGADAYELTVDVERGFLLRTEALMGGQPFRRIEVTGLELDVPLHGDVFTPQAPEGEEFEVPHHDRTVPLGQVGAEVPFTVFVPAPAPGILGFVHVADANRRRGTHQHVRLTYFVAQPGGGHGNLWVNESATELTTLIDDAWRQIGDLSILEDSSMGYLRVKVRLVRDGTYIHLETTALSVDELVRIARSLVSLPPSPPVVGPTPP